MSKYRWVTRCKGCGKIYPSKVPFVCEKCGEVLMEYVWLNDAITMFETKIPNKNAEKVAARKRFLRGWEVKQ